MENDNFDIKWLGQQMYGNELPSRKWYFGCKNRNDEICKDFKSEEMYGWLHVDENKTAEEYRWMVNEFRKRMGWEEYVI